MKDDSGRTPISLNMTLESEPLPSAPAAIPAQQVLSFVTHDIYGPASMLRTFLQAVGDNTPDEDLKGMIVDAERLCGQVEQMLTFLQIWFRLLTHTLEVEPQAVVVGEFLERWSATQSNVDRHDRDTSALDTVVHIDDRLWSLALQAVTWQMGRMGSRQGRVSLGIASVEPLELRIGRPDGDLETTVLTRAVAARDEDWTIFLRRLPACDFPLRMADRLLHRMGGELTVDSESCEVVVRFSVQSPSAEEL